MAASKPYRARSDEPKVGPEWVCLAVITGALGVRGAVRLKVFTEDLRSSADYGAITMFGLNFKDGKKFNVKLLHNIKGGIAAKIEGFDDRDAADNIRGMRFFIERKSLPKIEEDDGFYIEDLEGLDVKDEKGIKYGIVHAVFNYGAGDLIEVLTDEGSEKILYPFTDAIIPEVDVKAGYITVNRTEFGE
jgi:16S rRNA processing protein RimM